VAQWGVTKPAFAVMPRHDARDSRRTSGYNLRGTGHPVPFMNGQTQPRSVLPFPAGLGRTAILKAYRRTHGLRWAWHNSTSNDGPFRHHRFPISAQGSHREATRELGRGPGVQTGWRQGANIAPAGSAWLAGGDNLRRARPSRCPAGLGGGRAQGERHDQAQA